MEIRSPPVEKTRKRKGGLMKDGHYFPEPEIEVWVQNGKYHHDDGPAVINYQHGYSAWFKYGVRHREDGPAVIYEHTLRTNTINIYYYKGIRYLSIENNLQWRIEVQKMKRQERKMVGLLHRLKI